MFKKIFTLLMYLTLILSLTACGGGSAINSSSDGNNSSVSSGGGSNVNLKSQIQNATQVLDYSNNSSYYDFDRIEFGLDKYHNPIKWIVLEKNEDVRKVKYNILWGKEYSNEEKTKMAVDDLKLWIESCGITTNEKIK